jgi:prenyltransferase beta subunit
MPLLTSCSKAISLTLHRGVASLDPAARRQVADFILRRRNPEGGFRGRSQPSDLYYTVFGLECLAALQLETDLQPVRNFAASHNLDRLDFVHLTCLARCLQMLWPTDSQPVWAPEVKTRLEQYICPEGGFHRETGKSEGTIYESFLGMLACESLGLPIAEPEKWVNRLNSLQKTSGGFINGRGLAAATTPVTAAALAVYSELQQPAPPQAINWLLERQSSRGGFTAAALVPLPDLLSTATALQALRSLGHITDVHTDDCFDFVTSVWDDSGGFYSNFLERTPDCEYTFYALLALGNLVAESAP